MSDEWLVSGDRGKCRGEEECDMTLSDTVGEGGQFNQDIVNVKHTGIGKARTLEGFRAIRTEEWTEGRTDGCE